MTALINKPQEYRDVWIGALYGRASTKELVEAESLKKQEYLGLRYADQLSVQSGIEHRVKHILIEKVGISGAKAIRPELQKLEVLIRGRKIKFLIFEELSRLSRILKHLLEFLDLCKQYGVAVYIRGLPNVNLHSAAGEMFIHTLGSAAQFERSLTIERVKNTLRAAALRESKINGGSIVYGFARDELKKGNWIPIPEEIKNIEFMMDTFLEVGSITETIKISTKYGIKNKNGRAFDCTSLRKLFENRRLIGELHVVHGNSDELKSVVPLPFGAVIPPVLFQKVQKQIAINDGSRANMNRRGTKIYLLTGILQDQNGATYSGQSAICRNGRRKNYYYESKTKSRIDADQLEDKVLKSLSASIENNVELEKHSLSVSDARNRKIEIMASEIRRLKAEIREVEEKELEIIKGLSSLGVGASEATMTWLNGQVRMVEQSRRLTGERLEELSREREQLLKTEINLKKYQNRAVEIFRRMKKAAPMKQRQFMRQVIEKIEITPRGEVRIDWKFSEVFTGTEEVVAPTKNWLGTVRSPQPFPPESYFTNTLEFPAVRSYCDAFFLHQKYVVEGLTPVQIAAETFSSKKTVVSWLHRQKIPLKPEDAAPSQTPYGFRRVHGRLLESPQEQKTTLKLSDLRQQGFTYREIADIMNSLKIPTRKASGRWHLKTIHKILATQNRGSEI